MPFRLIIHSARRLGLMGAAALALLAGGCPTTQQWPAITAEPTQQVTPGRWVWAELFTADVASSERFYSQAFGWEFAAIGSGPDAYTLVSNAGAPIAGMLHRPAEPDAPRRARWISLMSVADVDAAAQLVRKTGGSVLIAPRELPGRGRVALLADPEGARFGVLRATSGDPADSFPSAGSWLWRELWAKDGGAMGAFYAPLGDYQVTLRDSGDGPAERHLLAGSYPRAGVVEHRFDDLPSAWLPYLRVDKLADSLSRVREAGGTVLIAPSPEIRQGRVAIIADPLGAALGLAEWPAPDASRD